MVSPFSQASSRACIASEKAITSTHSVSSSCSSRGTFGAAMLTPIRAVANLRPSFSLTCGFAARLPR